jgi:hypothetical protein
MEVDVEKRSVLSMISTLHPLSMSPSVLGMSHWMRTDLVLAATLLFLVFASWAMLSAAQTSLGQRPLDPNPNHQPSTAGPAESSSGQARRAGRQGFGTLSIVLGLLCSLALFVICAW